MFNFIRLSSEAQSAARWEAQRGYTGKAGDPLPWNISALAHREINENQAAFRLCVHLFRAFEFHN